MSASGVLSPNFSIFLNNDIVPLGGDFTIAAFGFQYQVSGVRIHRSASTGGGAGLTLTLYHNTNAGIAIASLAVPNAVGTYFLALDPLSGNRNVATTDALFVECVEAGAGIFEDINYIVIDCIGIQGVTPPILETGVPALIIT
jgi:hypothetical protein